MISAYPHNLDRSSASARRTLARANAAAALFLLAAGGLVTSTSSGLSVPDWPMSFGVWMPRMAGGVVFEHGHRMIAGLVGMAILAMAILTQREEPRRGVRLLGWAAAFGVLLQAVLGGLTVLMKLPVAVSAAHATLGQTVFVLLVLMADVLGSGEDAGAAKPAGSLGVLGLAAVGSLWLQLVLGAIMRHGGADLRWHYFGAVSVSLFCAWFAGQTLATRGERSIERPAKAVAGLLGAQLLLGAVTAALRMVPDPRSDLRMIAVATTHLVVGALLLAATALLTFRLYRGRAA